MYLSLIDTVSKIVKTYGVDILSDPKFWHILSDSYSFGNEYSLKDTFRSCLSTGYVSKLIVIKGNSKKTKAEITHIIDSENKLNPGKEKEYSVVLYSIAIAIGSCNKKDYSDFIKRNNPQPSPYPKPKPTPKPNNAPKKYNVSIKEWILSLTYYIIGVALAFGGTIFLSAFYNGWWLFFIVLFTGFAQLCYCACVMTNMEEVTNEDYKSTVLSFLFPVFCAFVSNALFSFFFFSENFRHWLGSHLSGFPYSPEGPYFITFLLIIIYVLFVGFASVSCYSSSLSVSVNLSKARRNVAIASGAIVTFLYLLLFFLPIIERGIREHNNKVEMLRKENLRNELINKNNKLHEDRIVLEKELSFKKIKLGISYDTAIEYANDNAEDKNPYSHSSTYDFLVSSEDGIIDAILKNEYIKSEEKIDNKNYYSGQSYTVKTILDNQEVYLILYERNGLVFAMIITPGSRRGSTFCDPVFDDLLKLYSSKYGEPENLGSALLDDTYHYGEENDKYLWQFKNGTVQLTNNDIVYVSADFIKSASQTFINETRIKEARQRHIADSIQIEQNRIDSIRREESKRDSIRRAHSHQNAINEI